MSFYFIIAVLVFVVCVLMVLVVLVQNSKGGGLASNFSSSNQYMGVRKTADFLEKTTWTLAIALLVLSLVSSIAIPKKEKPNTDQTEQGTQGGNDQNSDKTAPVSQDGK
jgi:preprotein translocase subunit SecG